jgi:hypothetical protein
MVTASVKEIGSGIEIPQPLLTHHTAMLTLFQISLEVQIMQTRKEVDELHGKKTTGKIVAPQNDEIRQMGGLNSAGIYTDLASLNGVVLDGLQRLHHIGSDPLSRSGFKYHRASAKNDIGFPPS